MGSGLSAGHRFLLRDGDRTVDWRGCGRNSVGHMRKLFSVSKVAAGAVLASVAVATGVVGVGQASAVTGGVEAVEPYSFLGSLQIADAYTRRADDHKCGVTLLAPQWAVTAAHCAKNPANALTGTPRGWKVRFGSLDEGSGGEMAEVDKFYRLVADGPGTTGRDVALLRLAVPVKAKPTRLASVTPAVGTPVRMVGWGDTCRGSAQECMPERLHEADSVLQAPSECESVGLKVSLCVGAKYSGVLAGNTDSGGPALVEEGGQWVVAGTVHAGVGRGQTEYTDVVRHADWINGIMSGARVPADDPVPDVDVSGAADLGGCAGSVVRSPTGRSTDPALVLTNGHCVRGDRPAPGAALSDQPVDQKVALLDRYGWVGSAARANRLVYATMTGTDVALYRIDKTYGQLAAAGVKMFDLADTPMKAGDKITMITQTDRRSCAVAAVVPHLREGGWEQDSSVRYDTCASQHGDSGSPLVSEDGSTVVGVNNTHNDGFTLDPQGGKIEAEPCSANNPCEVDANGDVTSVKAASYGQQVYQLSACLAEGSELDLNREGCILGRTEKPAA